MVAALQPCGCNIWGWTSQFFGLYRHVEEFDSYMVLCFGRNVFEDVKQMIPHHLDSGKQQTFVGRMYAS